MMRRWLERLATTWNTLTDAADKDLLLSGPLPLWMQSVYETEAERRGVDVGAVIFETLRERALRLRAQEA